MNIREFELHRPRLASQLKAALDQDYELVDVMPVYGDELLFRATVRATDIWGLESVIVCVSPRHPKSMLDEQDSDSRGTWWWASDLEERV